MSDSTTQILDESLTAQDTSAYVRGTTVPRSKARDILKAHTLYHATWAPRDPALPSPLGKAKAAILKTGLQTPNTGPSIFEDDEYWNKMQTVDDVLRYHHVYSKQTDEEKAALLSSQAGRARLQTIVDTICKNPAYRAKQARQAKAIWLTDDKSDAALHLMRRQHVMEIEWRQKGRDISEANIQPYTCRVLLSDAQMSGLNQDRPHSLWSAEGVEADQILSFRDQTSPKRGTATLQKLLNDAGIEASQHDAEIVLEETGSHSSQDEYDPGTAVSMEHARPFVRPQLSRFSH